LLVAGFLFLVNQRQVTSNKQHKMEVKMKNKILLLAVFLSLLNFVIAQIPEWIIYNTSNSDLPSDYVGPITIDENGAKWICTSGGGIAKFDGINWTIYNTSN
jgi:hypothetical protein